MIYEDKNQLQNECAKILELDGNDVRILDEAKLKNELIDDLIYTAVFSPDQATQEAARWLIRRAGVACGIMSASIQSLYEAMGTRRAEGLHGSGD